MSLLLPCHAITVRHFLLIGTRVLGRRNYRADDEMENSLVLCSEVIVYNAMNDGVDSATEKPQASGRDEPEIKRRT